MDLVKVLAQLREELANLDAAISSIERLRPAEGVRRRGRPPKAVADIRKSARATSPTPRAESLDSDDR